MKTLVQLLFWMIVGTVGVVTMISFLGGIPFFSESIPVENVTFEPLVPIDQDKEIRSVDAILRQPIAPSEQGVETSIPVVEESSITLLKARFLDEGGKPVAGVRLRPRWSSRTLQVRSDSQGRIEFPFGSDNGHESGSVVYAHPSIASDVIGFALRPGTTLDLGDIHVRAGGALSGRVVDGFGQALVGANVQVAGAEKVTPSGGGIVSSTTTSLGAAEGKTDEDGRFRFTGLRAGNIRVKVRAKQGLHTAQSGWVPIKSGQESQGLLIVAPELGREKRIEGYVYDPDGKPVAHAEVGARYKTFASGGSWNTHTDSKGFFRLVTSVDTGHDLKFEAPRKHDWAPIMRANVQPGSSELRISFLATQLFNLRVQDSNGEAISGYNCSVLDAQEEEVLQSMEQTAEGGSGLKLRIPDSPAVLCVTASGFATKSVKIAKGSLSEGSELSVVMEGMPGVRGLVMHNGKPVSGAQVVLQAKARGKSTYNGFPVRFDGRSKSTARTASDGTFYLDLHKSGDYVVRAVAPGLAPAESSVMDLSPNKGRAGIEFNLSIGGAIEGHLVLGAGSNPAGKYVAVSRGDCWAETRRVQSDGSFLFENLMPGPWMVKLVDEAIHDQESSSSSGWGFFPHDSPPSNCVVNEGVSTRYDLVLTPLSTCVLRGQLELQDVDMSSWRGSSSPHKLQDQSVGGIRTSFSIDAEGRFELRVKGAGLWSLAFESPQEGGLRFQLKVDLEEGLNQWSAHVPMAQLTLTGTPPETCFYLWRGQDNLVAMHPVSMDANGKCTLGSIPAGPAGLVLMSDMQGLESDKDWPSTWMDVDLPKDSDQVLPLRRQ